MTEAMIEAMFEEKQSSLKIIFVYFHSRNSSTRDAKRSSSASNADAEKAQCF